MNHDSTRRIYLLCIIKRPIIQNFACFNKKRVKQILYYFDSVGKQPSDVSYCLYRMKQIHWLLYNSTHYDWFRFKLKSSGLRWQLLNVTLLLSRNLLSRDSTQRIICVKFHVLADLLFFVIRWSLVDTLLNL